jgi:hypothetical protein
VATLHFGWVLIAAAKYRLVHALFGIFVPARRLRRAAARQAALRLGEALLRGAPPGQAGACGAPVSGRPPDRSMQGAPARRDRWRHGGAVPGAACRGRGADKVNDSRAHAEAIAVTEMIAPAPPHARRPAERHTL